MYSARILDEIQYKPGTWRGLKIGVFRSEGESEEQVGEYERNYPTLYRTFFPFQKEGKDFALYSPDYTVTRIMELPTCKDIGGEEPQSNGFCPVDLYVPAFVVREFRRQSGEVARYTVNKPEERDLKDTEDSKVAIPLQYYPFGFVAGCIWGDDSSWKIQYLDLSKSERGLIKRDDRFGYIEMPYALNLKESIDISTSSEGNGADLSVVIAIRKRFDLRTGKGVEVDEFS